MFARLREDSGRPSTAGAQPTADSRQPEDGPQPTAAPEPEAPSLIPVQNAALRSVKRLLVDLQNDALEHLRTDKAWVPEEEYTDRFGEVFSELATAITGDTDDRGAASAFSMDLYDSVSTAIVSARDAGSGDRAIAAVTSKVFRTWRSDEAERRVVSVAAELAGNTPGA